MIPQLVRRAAPAASSAAGTAACRGGGRGSRAIASAALCKHQAQRRARLRELFAAAGSAPFCGTALSPCSASPPLVTSSLADFDVDLSEPLGVGVCGAVYQATHLRSSKDVAIKIMSPSVAAATSGAASGLSASSTASVAAAEGIRREREAFDQLMQAGVSHPHVMGLLGYFQGHGAEALERGFALPHVVLPPDEPMHCSVMEHLGSCSLGNAIKEGPMEEHVVKDITRAVCEGLAFLHQQGIAHRDVKPANVLLAPVGDEEEPIGGLGLPKLIDFSHAGVLPEDEDPDAAWFDVPLGTAGYVAPEVLKSRQPYSVKCDVFSLGCIVHAMLAKGRPPRLHYRAGVITSLPETVSADGCDFVSALLHPDASHRPTVAEALQDRWLRSCVE